MIGRIVGISARNPIAVVLVTIAACFWGWWSIIHIPLDARSQKFRRRPSYRLLPLGSQSRYRRGSGYVSDRDGDARSASRENCSWMLRLRLLVCICHLRRQHGSLLGAAPEQWSIYSGVSARLPPGVKTEFRTRCHRIRLDLPIRSCRSVGTTQSCRSLDPIKTGM